MAPKRQLSDRSTKQRATLGALVAVQLTLLGAALADIRSRPARRINGDKRLWTALSFVNAAGPVAYFAFGRKR